MHDHNGVWRSDLSAPVAEELLAYLEKQVNTVALGVLLVGLVITFFARNAPLWMVAGWVVLVTAVSLFRLFVIRALPRDPKLSFSTPARLNIVTAIAGLNGIAHGSCVVFWPYLTDIQRAMQTLIVTGMCATTIVSGLGYMRAYIAYLLPMMLPTALAWTSTVTTADGAWSPQDALVTLVLFSGSSAALVFLARDTFQRFLDAHDARQRLHEALDQAEAANRAKTRFLASASHDLRQPMHALSLFAAAILMRPLDAASQAIARHIDTGLRTLSSQLDALLDISKLDAGVVPVRVSEFSASLMMHRLAADFESAAAAKSLRVVLESPPGIPARTDPVLLERVVRNLVDNAVKYTERGEIRIGLEAGELRHRLLIGDTGPGIPIEEQARVFEEFYQLGNPQRDRMQGLGLGLSIVQRLSDLLGLAVAMHSVPGRGTLFELQLPAAEAHPVSVPDTPLDSVDIRGLHVLVVDDEEAVRRAMEVLLDGFGCRTTLATGTPDAVRSALVARPDIVLADLRLRGADDGIAAIRALRERYPGLPALLVSGDTAPTRLRQAHSAGVRLLHKPVAVDALTQAIRQEIDLAGRISARNVSPAA